MADSLKAVNTTLKLTEELKLEGKMIQYHQNKTLRLIYRSSLQILFKQNACTVLRILLQNFVVEQGYIYIYIYIYIYMSNMYK